MKIEDMYKDNGFKMVVLEVDPYRIGEAVDYLLSLRWTEYIYDDILVDPYFYTSNVDATAFRNIEFITKANKANEVLSRCIGQDFITNAYTLTI